MVRVKICGITNVKDALHAVDAGADAIGFVFAPSKRKITVQAARLIVQELPPFVKTVGVFVNESLLNIQRIQDEAKLDLIQLSGEESEDFAESPSLSFISIRSCRVNLFPVVFFNW